MGNRQLRDSFVHRGQAAKSKLSERPGGATISVPRQPKNAVRRTGTRITELNPAPSAFFVRCGS